VAYRQSLVRRTARRVIDRARDWIDDHDPTELFMSIVGLFLIVGTLMVVFVAATPDPSDTLISLPPRTGQAKSDVVAYENAIGGYGFTYPSGWELTESGGRSRLESPNGGVVLSFEAGTAGGLEETTTHLVESLGGPPSTRELIGTRRDQIAGSPSLLTSGIGEDRIGRPVRYLAVAIRGEPINYGISILVPAGSSPGRLLPILEQIVASFEVVEPEPGPVAAGTGVNGEAWVQGPPAR
jgi:hypothetical protein